MRPVGVFNGRSVVAYDGGSSMSAGRAWWLLRYFGHRDVAVLDGGLAAWVAAGYPLSTDAGPAEPGDFIARAGAMAVLSAEDAAAIAARGALLDVRAPERFRGEREPIDAVAGHIPGALNVPATVTTDPSGRFLDRHTLRQLFEQAGLSCEERIGAYCGSGVVAAHEVLALEVAGYDAALYPGSWSEWISNPRRPIARGD